MNRAVNYQNRSQILNSSIGTRESTVAVNLTDAQVQNSINETARKGTGTETLQRHNRNVELFIDYIIKSYEDNMFEITDGDLSSIIEPIDFTVNGRDKEKFITLKRPKTYRTKDIVWHNLPISLVKAYLETDKMKFAHNKNGTVKVNENGEKLYTNEKVATNFATSLKNMCRLTHGNFSPTFRLELEDYIHVIKKQRNQAKKEGRTDENAADPIPYSLLYCICLYAVTTGNVLLWAFSLLLWNCIGRIKNIAELKFTHFSLHEDCIGVCYDDTKTKKEGEQLNIKHIYANIKDWHMNCLCAMGVYFMFHNSSWLPRQMLLFMNYSKKGQNAASNYAYALKKFVQDNLSRVKSFMSTDHFNPYGLRKGPATHASSSTTAPPPISSIFLRGEWSMGTVIDIYWKYASAGDTYLGRVLAGFFPADKNFDVLPPHFIVGMEDSVIQEAMKICFGNILHCIEDEQETAAEGLLYRCLASVVYHSDDIIQHCTKNQSGHPFMNIPLFQNQSLLEKLKKLVTIEPTAGICEKATGVPPHVETNRMLRELSARLNLIEENYQKVIDDRQKLIDDFTQAMITTLDNRDLANNTLTVSNFKDLLQENKKELSECMNEQFEKWKKSMYGFQSTTTVMTQPTIAPVDPSQFKYRLYNHGGMKQYFVPSPNYNLPKSCKLLEAIGFIVNGDLACRTQRGDVLEMTPVRPFVLWTDEEGKDFIPQLLYRKFKSGWMNTIVIMKEIPEFKNAFKKIHDTIAAPNLDPYIFKAEEIASLKERYISYIINKKAEYMKSRDYSKWSITTWSKRVHFSEIQKNGTEADIASLPTPTFRNKRRKFIDK